jgi:hypothetical protein
VRAREPASEKLLRGDQADRDALQVLVFFFNPFLTGVQSRAR